MERPSDEDRVEIQPVSAGTEDSGVNSETEIAMTTTASSTLNREQIVELADRFKHGDELAFNRLAESLGRRAYYIALKATGDADLAEDIAQDSLIKVYHYIHRLEDLRTIMNWHYRIVLNLINDYYRKLARHARASETIGRLKEMEIRGQETPLSEPARQELAAAIQDAIAQLDERHRTVFILKEIQGESHAAIAEMLDIPIGTVWSRLSHARARLQSYLEAKGFTP